MQSTTDQGRKTVIYSADGFHKPTYSNSQGACVEVKEGATTAVRDTQNRELGHLSFSGREWAALLGAVA